MHKRDGVEAVNNVVSGTFGSQGFQILGIPQGLFNLKFKTSLHLLQLLGRILQRCFAVKLKKSFEDYETSLEFLSAQG